MRLALSGLLPRGKHRSGIVIRPCRSGGRAGSDAYSLHFSQAATTQYIDGETAPACRLYTHRSINPALAMAKCFDSIHRNACNTTIPGPLAPLPLLKKTHYRMHRTGPLSPMHHLLLYLISLLPSRIFLLTNQPAASLSSLANRVLQSHPFSSQLLSSNVNVYYTHGRSSLTPFALLPLCVLVNTTFSLTPRTLLMYWHA